MCHCYIGFWPCVLLDLAPVSDVSFAIISAVHRSELRLKDWIPTKLYKRCILSRLTGTDVGSVPLVDFENVWGGMKHAKFNFSGDTQIELNFTLFLVT